MPAINKLYFYGLRAANRWREVKIKEHRRSPRIKDNIFIFFQSMKGDGAGEAITNNISQGGLMFRVSKFLSEGIELKLEICQPLNSDKDTFLSMPVRTRVAWIKQTEDNEGYLVGAEITRMSKGNQNKLIGYIKNRLKCGEYFFAFYVK